MRYGWDNGTTLQWLAHLEASLVRKFQIWVANLMDDRIFKKRKYKNWNFTDMHNFTLQHRRVIRIMHYRPTLRHIPTLAVCTRTLAKGVHWEDLWWSTQPRHTCAALIILLLISLTLYELLTWWMIGYLNTDI